MGALGLAWLAAAAGAAGQKTVNLPAFAYPEALPALLAAAGRAGVAVDTRERPVGPREARAGDAMTFLVSLRDGDRLKQWVLVAEMSDLTGPEAEAPARKGFHAFSSTGTEINLGGRRAAIEMTLIGPVTGREGGKGDANPEVRRRRLLVNGDYLSLGFDAGCEAILGLRAGTRGQAGDAARFQPAISAKPFSPDVAQANAARARQLGFTPDRERAFFGAVPVLLEVVNLIIKTPGLQDIMKEVVDVSWWSVLSSGGKARPHIRIAGGSVQKFPVSERSAVEQYAFPFVLEVNEKPAMASVLVVTKPDAPLATTGGVIGLQAGRPFDPDPQLTVRLIATRCRDAAPAAPAPGR